MNVRALLNYVWLTAELFVVGALGMMALLSVGAAVALVVSLLAAEVRAESISGGVVDNPVHNSGGNYLVDPADVLDVYDGDTFYIKVPACAELVPVLCARLGVRVNGIDTPEMHGKCQSERDHALAAKAVTVGMIKNAKSIVLRHVVREKYGRLLASVEIDGVDLAATLISGGYARAYHGEARTGWCDTENSMARVSL